MDIHYHGQNWRIGSVDGLFAVVKGWMFTSQALADRWWVSISGKEAKGFRVSGGEGPAPDQGNPDWCVQQSRRLIERASPSFLYAANQALAVSFPCSDATFMMGYMLSPISKKMFWTL